MQKLKNIKLFGKRKSSNAVLLAFKGNSGLFLNNILIDIDIFIKDYSLELFSSILKEHLIYNEIKLFVHGGGYSSQKDALRYVILKYISLLIPSLKNEMKKNKILIKNSRVKERKLYGHLKARKKKQYSKR